MVASSDTALDPGGPQRDIVQIALPPEPLIFQDSANSQNLVCKDAIGLDGISLQSSGLKSLPFVAVLYVFCGEARKSDVGELLRTLTTENKILLHLVEVDLVRSASQNMTAEGYWKSLMDRILQNEFKVVIMTPPCSTFSRARNSNSWGPPPVRSKKFPWGYPWLSGRHLQGVTTANLFVRQTLEGCLAAHTAGAAFLAEHPEDLGTTDDLQQPASIFAMEELHKLCQQTGAITAAFHQCPWGAPSSKPTRVVSTLDLEADSSNCLYHSWPKFDKKGFYLGPLPRKCGHNHKALLGRTADGSAFKTSASASYPAAMCQWIVSMIVRFCQRPKEGVEPSDKCGTTSSLGSTFPPHPPASLTEESSEEEEPGVPKQRLADHIPGFGPPLKAVWAGKVRELHDGGGLCSPGRWLPGRRKLCSWKKVESVGSSLSKLLFQTLGEPAKVCFKLACGRCHESPFSDSLITAGRKLLAEAVAEDSSFSVQELLEVQENQPFLLRLIGETLRLMGDPDWRVYFKSNRENFWDGVSVGPGTKMPRTPAVFERKVKFRSYDETEFSADVANYKSAAGPAMAAILEGQFQEEAELGMMYRATLSEAKDEWIDLRISAQGAIEKNDESWRILHDATHGVNINNQTTIRDQLRMPSAGDQRTVMQESAEHDEGPHFSLQFDVSKAHRRFLHKRKDWGYLCCRSDDKQEGLWVNRVGTFGLTCASYWWGRLAAGVARLVIRFFAQRWVIQLLFADDNRMQANGPDKFKDLLLGLFLWVLVGTPLSWRKTKGGLSCEWIGFWIDYQRFELGLSESRALWLARWGQRVVTDGLVQMRDFAEGLGRLGFCAGILEFYKPFLAPLYAWSSAAPPGAVLAVPPLVRLTLSWITAQITSGRRMVSCRKAARDLGLLFKTDAKGEESYVVLGGWECLPGHTTMQSRWFSLTLTRDEVPWLFVKGHGSRTIGASELLATMLAVHLFLPLSEQLPAPSKGTVQCRGETDNQGNTYIVSKMMTTSFPLSAVLMQLTSMLGARNLWLGLGWIPREQNEEADALTNDEFSGFDSEKRIPVSWGDLPLDVLAALLKEGENFLQEIAVHKENKKRALSLGVPTRKLKRKLKTPWG